MGLRRWPSPHWPRSECRMVHTRHTTPPRLGLIPCANRLPPPPPHPSRMQADRCITACPPLPLQITPHTGWTECTSVWALPSTHPTHRLTECILACRAEVTSRGLFAPMVGHVGDGNFHYMQIIDPGDPAQVGGDWGGGQASGRVIGQRLLGAS